MKVPTATAAQTRTTRQIAPIVTMEPDSIIWAKIPWGVGVRDGRGVAVSIKGMGVLVVGRTTTISGASSSVGDGVSDGVTVGVGVSVNAVGVVVGVFGVAVFPGVGVRVSVGVGDVVGVAVSWGSGVLLDVAVGVGLA